MAAVKKYWIFSRKYAIININLISEDKLMNNDIKIRPAAWLYRLTVLSAAVILLLSAACPFRASAAKKYRLPSSGTLLYTMDFAERDGWSPKKGASAAAVLSVTAVEGNPLAAAINATADAKNHNWGGGIEGLPLNDYTGYTVFFTVRRSHELSSKDPNLGVYIDGCYGFYGYSTNLRLLKGMDTLHDTVTFTDLEADIEGNTWDSTDSIEHYAIEVNGSSRIMRVFIRDTDWNYILVDATKAGEITEFADENLGLWFHQYNTNMTVIIENFQVWSGNILTGDKIKEAPETTRPVQTEGPEEQTTSPEETTDTDPDVTEAGPDVTAEDTGAGTEPATENGCAASGAMLASVIPAVTAVFIRRRKSKDGIR